jgi:cytosol alanyl aminopeptidase
MLARSLLAAALAVTLAGSCAPPPAPLPPRVVEPPPPPLAAPREDGRLPELATARAYALELEIDPAAPEYRGVVRVELEVLARTAHVVLRGGALTIDGATLRAGAADVRADARRRASSGGEELVLALARAVDPGPATLELRFRGRIGPGARDGLARADVGGAPALAYAPGGRRGREPFPALDGRAPIALSVRAPRDMTVTSSAAEERSEDLGTHVSHRFPATAAMLPSELALLVGKLDVTSGPGDAPQLRVLTPRGAPGDTSAVLDLARTLVSAASDDLGVKLPFARLDVLALTPDMLAPADPSLGAGLVVAAAPLGVRGTPAMALGAAIARQWFGVATSGVTDDDRWLDRGASCWLGARAADRADHGGASRVAKWRAEARAMDRDGLSRATALRSRERAPGEWAAEDDAKAEALLSTVAAWLGDEAVLQALRARVAGPASSPADELLTEIDRATGRDVSRMMTGYLDAPGVPEINVHITCDPRKRWHAEVSNEPLSFAPARPAGESDPRTWVVPVCVLTDGGERPCAELAEGAPSLVAGRGCPSALDPNPGRAYYRAYVSASKGVKLQREAARSDELGRVAAISNAESAFRSGKLAAAALLDALAAADDDPTAEVVREVTRVLEDLDDLAPSVARERLRAFADARLSGARTKLGWEPKTDEPRERADLRAAVLAASARFSDEEDFVRDAVGRADRWLTGAGSLTPDAAAAALSVAARGASVARAEALLRPQSGGVDASLAARALAASAPPAVLERVLESLVASKGAPRVLFDALSAATRSRDARAELDGWLRARWAAVEERLGVETIAISAELVRRTCDEADAKQRIAWYTARARALGAGRGRIALAAEEAMVCVDARGRAGADLARALAATPTKLRQPARQ